MPYRSHIRVIVIVLTIMGFCAALFVGMIINTNIIGIALSLFLVTNVIVREYVVKGNWLTMGTIFSVLWFLYTNANLVNNYNNELFLSQYNIKAFIGYCLAFIAFMGAYWFFPVKLSHKYLRINGRTVTKVVVFCSVLSLVIMVYYYLRVLGIHNILSLSRASRSLIVSNMRFTFLFAGIRDFLYLVPPTLYLLYSRTQYTPAKIMVIITVVFNVSMALLTIDRSNLLFATLPIGYLLIKDRRVNKFVLLSIVIIAFVLLVDFKSTMSSLINQRRLVPVRINIPEEFLGSFQITAHIMKGLETGEIEFAFGKTYLDTIKTTVFPLTDVEPLSIWYVRTYRYDVYSRGGGLAFSSVAEAYMNLGFIAVFLYFFLIGLFVRLLEKRKDTNDLALIMYSLIFPLTYKFFRSEAYSLIKTGVWFWVLPLFLFYVLYQMTMQRAR